MSAVNKLTKIVTGEPVRFEFGGQEWSLRQPTPAEVTQLLFWREIGEAKAWEMLRESGEMTEQQVSDAVANAGVIGYLQGQRSMTDDAGQQEEIDERIAKFKANDQTSILDEKVMAFAIAYRDQRAIEMLLDAPDELRKKFTSSVMAMAMAREYVQVALSLAYQVPNF